MLLKNRNKKVLIILLFLIQTIFAQTSYEYDVHYGFGASELAFNSVPGFAASIYPVKNFGVSVGFEYSWRWKTKTYETSGENPITVDSEGDSLIFRYTIGKCEEKQTGKVLQIPLLLKYSNDLYYTAAGLKLGIVQEASSKISYKNLETEGYYPQDNITLTEPLFQGFGSQNDSSSNKKRTSENLFMLSFEGGLKWKLNDNFALSAGIFADYSLNKGFERTLLPAVERKENKNGANIVVNDSWKKWNPWSVGVGIKFSFISEPKPQTPEPEPEPESEPSILESLISKPKNHNIEVKIDSLIKPKPVPIEPVPEPKPEPVQPAAQNNIFQVPPLPKFLLNREADFIFFYPETRTSPSDSLHQNLISQIADTLRANPALQLHCVGYSEKLISESTAYEIALQRSIRIRYILTRFYAIEENRIFVYSKGSENSTFRKAECFAITPN